MHIFLSISTKLLHSKFTSFKSLTWIPTVFLLSPKQMSQSTSIPRNQQRIRDHGYDDYMEVEKKTRKVMKFQELLLTQPNSMIAISRLDMLARRFGFKQYEAGKFILKFPHVFEVFEHPVQRILYCRLTRKSLLQIEQEKQALLAQLPQAVTRLRKLLMLSNTGRLRLEHVRIARKEFGLPDDFEFSVVLKYPKYFRLFDAKETRNKYIEVVERDPQLAVCAVENVREREYREKGGEEENVRFSFKVNFPPGFKIGKYYKIAVWKWQRLPYWLPYEDISGYDLRSLEAQKRMEKRAVATIHELLSLTVEKKITLERIAHFRLAMDLPKKLKDFLLQHQGIFYISTRGNQGKLHTVFLREAYKKGELIEPNDLYLARRRLAELVLLSPRKAIVDKKLVNYRKREDDDEIVDYVENGGDHSTIQETVREDLGEDSLDSDREDLGEESLDSDREDLGEESLDSDDDCSIDSEYTHTEVSNDDFTDNAEDTRVTE
ncbi:Protein ROOT PRIMORDIUM DEFTIVE 1 [Datura stramonium]|uniref:Protein ROOT PRIMORDIUM DEFTIVE 1 n=1 Tax=Datura stramonium TaxID=4076 RepID=A0ABS8ULI4_DATST|nr:Protein ROOT PRIMORDIUM DEFTIVE 1 [Datura stramonium]